MQTNYCILLSMLLYCRSHCFAMSIARPVTYPQCSHFTFSINDYMTKNTSTCASTAQVSARKSAVHQSFAAPTLPCRMFEHRTPRYSMIIGTYDVSIVPDVTLLLAT